MTRPNHFALLALAATVLLASAASVHAQNSIDPANMFCWGENIGWVNWRDAGSPVGSEGVRYVYTYLTGFAWSENTGFVNFGQTPADGVTYTNTDGSDFGINHDENTGYLSGFAWGENIGWINFDGGALATPENPARISVDPPRRILGYAWGENVGWINLDLPVDGQYIEVRPCRLDYNLDGALNPDDLGDFITDYYTVPHIPGPGGYAGPCPENDPPYDMGYKTAFTSDESVQCNAPFPDNLGDFITDYYAASC
ncbi:MAG: hypothetical protein ACKVS8_08085 [Phycisphaerales bacterium]